MKQQYTFRKFIYDIHLWLGLPSAIVLLIMCLTGTIYVFQKDITQWVDKDKFKIQLQAGATMLPVNQLAKAVAKEKNGKVTLIQVPQNADEAWTFTVLPKKDKKAEKATDNKKVAKTSKDKAENEKVAPKQEKTKSYLVNPYTGVIQGDAQTPTAEFFATALKLHRWLLIENHDIGGGITGVACIMMIFLQITGLMLWAPTKIKNWGKFSAWKQGFKIKTDAKFKRINFDMHKALGFYAFIFVTIMALTGPYFAFTWYKNAFAQTLTGKKPSPKETAEQSVYINADTKPLAFEKILDKVNTIYPYQGTTRITLPKDSLGTVNVLKYKSGFLTSAGLDRVILDQYSGKVIVLNSFAQKSLGEKIVSSAKLIHTGELFGTFSKILYFIACLIATSLPVTGFLIWWGRNGYGSKKKTKTLITNKSMKEVISS